MVHSLAFCDIPSKSILKSLQKSDVISTMKGSGTAGPNCQVVTSVFRNLDSNNCQVTILPHGTTRSDPEYILINRCLGALSLSFLWFAKYLLVLLLHVLLVDVYLTVYSNFYSRTIACSLCQSPPTTTLDCGSFGIHARAWRYAFLSLRSISLR